MLDSVSEGTVVMAVISSTVGRIGGMEAESVSAIVLNTLRKPDPPAYAVIAPGSGVLPCPDKIKMNTNNNLVCFDD